MKTLLIAHRGNTNGPNKNMENNPNYIEQALQKGFDCEIDLRYDTDSKKYYLGHDQNQYEISFKWLLRFKENLWIHCKDFASLNNLSLSDDNLNYFWHEEDRFTLTSKGYIWTFPGNLTSSKSIIVTTDDKAPETNCYGICSDYVEKISKLN